MTGLWKTVVAALVGGFAIVATQASAQNAPKVGDRIGDWVFNCRALSATETVCAVTQGIADAKTKKQVLRLTVQKTGAPATPFLHALLPQGVYLGENISGDIDQKTPLNFTWRRCTNNGCQASVKLDKGSIAAMKSGQKLDIKFKVQESAAPVTISGSLKGMTASFDALGIK